MLRRTDKEIRVASDGCTIVNNILAFCTARDDPDTATCKIILFDSFDRRCGYGTRLVRELQQNCIETEYTLFADGILPESRGFWEKVGVPFSVAK